MKRNYYFLISICLIIGFVFAGCSGAASQALPDNPSDVTESEEDKEEPEKEETKKKSKKKNRKADEESDLDSSDEVENRDYEAAYQPVFDEIFEILEYGYNIDREYDYASGDLTRKIDQGEKKYLWDEIGYHYEDISGDGIPELLIGYNADYLQNGGESYISGIYTIKDGKPYTSFACSDRSGYMRMDDSHFFYTGNIDAHFNIMGKNHLSEDGTEIVWDDCYFMDEKEDGTIGFYHNRSGVIDAAESEEMNISEEDYYEIMDDCAYSCTTIGWIPIGSLKDTTDVSAGNAGREEPFGKEIKIDAATQKKMNVFLSNFSEAYLSEYDIDHPDTYSIFRWAYLWTKINKQESIKYEQYPLGGSDETCEKISVKDISKITEKYLGLTFDEDMAASVKSKYDDNGVDCAYDSGYFYLPASDGEAYTSFSVVSKAEDLGSNKLKLYYTVYAQELDAYFDGKEINYGMTDEEASKDKDTEDEPRRKGYAIVSVSGSSYKLEYLE